MMEIDVSDEINEDTMGMYGAAFIADLAYQHMMEDPDYKRSMKKSLSAKIKSKQIEAVYNGIVRAFVEAEREGYFVISGPVLEGMGKALYEFTEEGDTEEGDGV